MQDRLYTDISGQAISIMTLWESRPEKRLAKLLADSLGHARTLGGPVNAARYILQALYDTSGQCIKTFTLER